MTTRMKMDEKTLARFVEKLEEKEDGCIVWKKQHAMSNDGYGQFKFLGKRVQAHRLSYSHFVQEIPSGYEIDHECCERSCVNPAHLKVVTHEENIRLKEERRKARLSR